MLTDSDDDELRAPNGAWIVAGSRIVTKTGMIPIENLSVNDEVITRNSGFQRVQYLGNTRHFKQHSQQTIMISTGALNNKKDIFISPNHMILIYGPKVQKEFGKLEYLVAAKDLVNGKTIVNLDANYLEYHCVLFDKHELIYVEGAAVESFNPYAIKQQEDVYFSKDFSVNVTQKQTNFIELNKPIISRSKASVLRQNPEILLRT